MNEFIIKNGLIVSGSAEIGDNLTIHGTLTANQYNVSVISSSVLYESGSTQFGDSIDDTHLFTGSIRISGSIDLNGQTLGTGKLDETTFESFTSSYLDVSSSLDGRVSDLESFSSSLDTSFVSEIEFGSHTSSINGRVDDLETESGSIRGDFNLFTSSYTNVSTSIDSRLDTLETLSGSFTGSFSGSFNGDGTNLYNIPASGVTGLNLTQIADGSVTASVSNTNGLRVNSKTEITGSLIVTNGITGSIDYSNITNKPTLVSGSSQIDITSTTGYSAFSSSVSSSIGSLSSSIATTTNDLDGRLDNVETSTGSLNSFTSSINTTIKDKLNDEGVISGSVQVTIGDTTGFSTFSSSVSSSIGSLSSSIATTTNDLDGRVDSIETSTGSLNSFTSSINTTIKDKLNTEGVVSGSIQVSITGTTGFSEFSSSISSSVTTIFVDNFEQDGRLDAIETSTGSLNSFTSSINTTIKNKLNTENVISGSVQVNLLDVTGYSTFSSSISSNIESLSSSVATIDNAQNGRLSSLEGKSGSYATTGSNIFVGSQTISGSVIIRENLLVLGSSSITYVTSSQLRVDDNVIVVNTASPAERFGGLQVYDSGSAGEATGSLFWDSQKNRWVYQNSSEASYGGGVLLSGPRSSGSLGDELTLTSGKIARSAGGDHLNDSIITEYSGATIGISGSLDITGSLKVSNGITLPIDTGIGFGNNSTITNDSESGEFFFRTLGNNIYLGTVDSSIGIANDNAYISAYSSVNIVADASGGLGTEQLKLSNGFNTGLVVQPSGNITFATLSDDLVNKVQIKGSTYISSSLVIGKTSANAKLDVNGDVLVTGSITATGTVRGSNITEIEATTGSLNSFTSSINTTIKNKLNSDGVISGSSQISFGMISAIPSGLVSGSSQVLNGSGVWSGSAQLPSGIISGSSQVLSGTGIWSGSAQLPSGVVSGSSQVLAGTTIHSGSFFNGISVVSGSAQISFGSITGVPSGLVSGSSQITYGSLTGIPSGIVSGSGQITLSSTSGFGSYLNQAVLTTSTPTFDLLTIESNSDNKINLKVKSGDTSDWNYINFYGVNGVRDCYFGTNGSGEPTWYRDDNGVNISLGSTAMVNGTQIVTNSGTWSISISGNASTASSVAWSGISSKPTTISGYGITDAITTSNIGSQSVSYASTAGNITSYTINQNVGSGNSPSFVDINLSGGLTVGGSLSRGTYTVGSNFVSGADNIVLKGNSSGVSGIYFESEKDGTSINYPSDFGFIQFHPYGVGGSTGEQNRLVIGVSNDSDDMIVLNPVGSDGVKVRVGTGTTEYTVYHSGNIPTWNQNTTGTASNITSYTINQSVGTGNSPTFAGLTVNGNVTLGNTNGHYTRMNDTLYLGASDSGDSHFYFGEDSSGWFGSYWYWDSGYNHYWYSRHAGGNTLLMYHDTRETTNVYFQRNILPTSNNAYNLGSASLGWANVYTNDLHLSNMNKPEGNDIDGTNGTWTIQEGAENLYIINNRNNKKFKISLEEIL